MDTRFYIILGYLLITLVIGLLFHSKAKKSSIDFFLAGRNISGLLLFFTMAASNFSAFTIFGLSGAGYRIGYAFYPVMGFGTGFMALSMYIVGRRIIPLSKERNYITPADFFLDRYGSKHLKTAVSIVMVVFTLPYLALQAIAGGNSLHALTGVPYTVGVLTITFFVVLYVALGGLHSIAWTDFLQGVMMIVFTVIAFGIIARKGGGFVSLNTRLFDSAPDLFSRPGADGTLTPRVWFGYMFLWFFSVPFTPHLFQRFMAARSTRDLKKTVFLYPLITTFLFFLTVGIGVMGRFTFPDLPIEQSDSIFPMLLNRYTSLIGSTLILTGSIAALMSTMDSQLLTLSSIIAFDLFPHKTRAETLEAPNNRKGERVSRPLIICCLGVLAVLVALRPPQTLLAFISSTTFNGLSVLAPIVFGGLYWEKANARGAFFALCVGELMVVLYFFKLLPAFGFLPVVPIVCVSAAVFAAVSYGTRPADGAGKELTAHLGPAGGTGDKMRVAAFLILFALAHDFWNWGRTPLLYRGLPVWIWYYIGLGILLAAAYRIFFITTLKTKRVVSA